MTPLENERCPDGGPGLQVTGAGPQGQRAPAVPFPHYSAATCCALSRAVPWDYRAPAGHEGGEGCGPLTSSTTLTLPARPTATVRCRFPPAARSRGTGECSPRGGCLVRWRSFCRSRHTLWPSSWARPTASLRRSPRRFNPRPRFPPNPGSLPDTTSGTRSSQISKRRTCNTSGTRRSQPRWLRLFS